MLFPCSEYYFLQATLPRVLVISGSMISKLSLIASRLIADGLMQPSRDLANRYIAREPKHVSPSPDNTLQRADLPMWLDGERHLSCKQVHAGANPVIGSFN